MSFHWYIVHTHSGAEKKVAQAIKEQAERKGIIESFEDVCVPTEEIVEIKRGKKINSQRKFFPGYVMVKMELNDEAWHLVKNIPKVTGFLGNKEKPQPISDDEAAKIFKQVEEGMESPKYNITFEVGESVKVIDGPFDTFIGVVEDLDREKERLKVGVSIFGRSTPVELEFTQVEKLS